MHVNMNMKHNVPVKPTNNKFEYRKVNTLPHPTLSTLKYSSGSDIIFTQQIVCIT